MARDESSSILYTARRILPLLIGVVWRCQFHGRLGDGISRVGSELALRQAASVIAGLMVAARLKTALLAV